MPDQLLKQYVISVHYYTEQEQKQLSIQISLEYLIHYNCLQWAILAETLWLPDIITPMFKEKEFYLYVPC